MIIFIRRNFVRITLVIFIVFMFILSISSFIVNKRVQRTFINDSNYKKNVKQDILCLMAAYSEYISDIEYIDNSQIYIVMKSGKKIIYDDKRSKSIEEKISNPDLQDMMEQMYPLSDIKKISDKIFDPGRARVYDLLNEVYGRTKGQIENNLLNVSIGGSYQFNGNNGASEALKNAMKEIITLKKDILGSVFPCSGTYNYRYISGTSRLSPHSFGIAIDLARDKRDYWKWASREQGQKRLDSYPREIIQIFEKHNFIWGGKWGHFDILHFEYRPEIILKAKYFEDNLGTEEIWYQEAMLQDPYLSKCIERINQVIIE